MLIRFTDDYENYLYEAKCLIGRIITYIGVNEPFIGSSKELDRFYALSMVLSGIIDHLDNDDNKEPKYNEYLLEILKELLSKNLCGTNNEIPQKPISLLPKPVNLNKLIR